MGYRAGKRRAKEPQPASKVQQDKPQSETRRPLNEGKMKGRGGSSSLIPLPFRVSLDAFLSKSNVVLILTFVSLFVKKNTSKVFVLVQKKKRKGRIGSCNIDCHFLSFRVPAPIIFGCSFALYRSMTDYNNDSTGHSNSSAPHVRKKKPICVRLLLFSMQPADSSTPVQRHRHDL